VKALINLGHEVEVVALSTLTPPQKLIVPMIKISQLINYYLSKLKQGRKTKYNDIQVYNVYRISIPYFISWSIDSLVAYYSNTSFFRMMIRNNRPDLIISSGLNPGATLSKYMKHLSRVRYFSIFEGSDILFGPSKYKGIKKIIKTVNIYVDKVIFVSNHLSKKVVDLYNIENHIILSNGYNDELFYFDEVKDVNRKNPEYRILSIGGLTYVKGHDIMLEALRHIHFSYQVTIIGEGERELEYLKVIKSQGLSVKLIPPQNQSALKRYYTDCDVVCIPSRSESFGIVALEAMACGTPVVAAKVGEFPDLIVDGVNGYLFETESSQDLANQINLANQTQWDPTIVTATLKNKYSWHSWANSVTNIYDELVSHN